MSSETNKTYMGLTCGDLLLIFVAGVVGEIILEIIAWGVFPEILGMPMRPHILLTDLGQRLIGVTLPVPLAVGMHLTLGMFIMPVVYVKAKQALGMNSWLVAGIIWGVILWLVAESTLAPLAGRPIFLNFIPYSWGSLIAHIVYTVIVAGVLDKLTRRFPNIS